MLKSEEAELLAKIRVQEALSCLSGSRKMREKHQARKANPAIAYDDYDYWDGKVQGMEQVLNILHIIA